MDHADFHMICLQSPELVRKALPDLINFSSALVLAILPDGTQVSLKNKFLPPSPQSPTQVGTHLWIGGIEVYAVDAVGLHFVYKRQDLLVGLIHKSLAPHANLTDADAGAAQCTVYHFMCAPFQAVML